MVMSTWTRYDLQSRQIEGGRIEVYRRNDRLGRGACMSLYANDSEIMRFDLFDPAHEHWAIGGGDRMYYPKAVDRFALAIWHLRHYGRPCSALVQKGLVTVTDMDAQWAKDALESARTQAKAIKS